MNAFITDEQIRWGTFTIDHGPKIGISLLVCTRVNEIIPLQLGLVFSEFVTVYSSYVHVCTFDRLILKTSHSY